MSNQLYKLQLVPSYPNDSHHRAGLVLSRGGTLVTELSKDQLEAVKNDSSITLSKAEDGEQSQTPGISDQGAGVADSASVGADKPDRSASEEAEAAEDLGAESEEENAGQDQGADGEGVADDAAGEESAAEDAAEATAEAAEDQAVAQSTADQVAQEGAENASDDTAAPTADSLVRDHSREELNKIAVEAGVEAPELLDNKPAVAQAIIEKRA